MKYSIEFYKTLKIGQYIYRIDYEQKINVYEIQTIVFSETIDNAGIRISSINIYAIDKNRNSKDFDKDSSIYLSETELLNGIFGISNTDSVDVIRLEKVLHSLRQHPDYEYDMTQGPRKNWHV